jgi:flagellar basal body-associated protein FliL
MRDDGLWALPPSRQQGESMYPGQKKSAMTWVAQIFFGIAVLVFIGAVVFVMVATRDDGQLLRGGGKAEPKGPLSIER